MSSKDQTAAVREQIKHMFASAWQDGVHHLDPKYLRRDTLFTDEVMQLITANYTPNAEVAERERLARVDENKSLLYVAEDEIELGDKCYNHEKHTPACYACRKRKMYVEYSKDWKSSIDERLSQLSKEAS